MAENEVHVCQFHNGHVNSVDCWCEPTAIYWYCNVRGLMVLVVEHDDDTAAHHYDVLKLRDAENDWVTQLLESLTLPPPTKFFGTAH